MGEKDFISRVQWGFFYLPPPPLFFLLVLGVLVVFFRLGVVCCEGLAPAGIYRAGVGAQPGGTGSIQADAVGRGGWGVLPAAVSAGNTHLGSVQELLAP